MPRDRFDVVLQHVDISEHGVIDALQHISRLALHYYLIGVVDESVAQRLDVFYGFWVNKMTSDGEKFVHDVEFFAKIVFLSFKFLFLP
jgi:hypothetical protein